MKSKLIFQKATISGWCPHEYLEEVSMAQLSVGVAIITHNSRHHLRRCIEPLTKSTLQPRILVVNSSSRDGTIKEAERLGAATLVIPRQAFNHGATRELARNTLHTDIVVMMTPDAYPRDPQLLEILIQPLLENKAALAYARQIPHVGADLFASFPRHFNYPEDSHIRCLSDLPQLGVYAYFCSNSCSAYRNDVLDEVGGFPTVLLGEDTVIAAKFLRKGYRIAYVAEAVVHHSHRYSLLQEFRRHFDIGYSREQQSQHLSFGVNDSSRGRQYLKRFLPEVARRHPHKLPYALLHLMAKWTGYQVGRRCVNGPTFLSRALSSQEFYWVSDHYPNRGNKRR